MEMFHRLQLLLTISGLMLLPRTVTAGNKIVHSQNEQPKPESVNQNIWSIEDESFLVNNSRDFDKKYLSHIQEVEVQESSPYCQFERGVLTCDFQWSEENVYVPSLPQASGSLDEIFIQRAHHLRIDGNVCTNVVLHHIGDIQTTENNPTLPCSGVNLSLLNVTLDHLMDGITYLHVTSSRIVSLYVGVKNKGIFIIDSHIQLLSIISENNDVKLQLKNTYIARVEDVYITGNSSIFSTNITIGDVPQKAIILGTSGNILEKINLPKQGNMAKQGIMLQEKSDVTLIDISGSIHVQSQPCNYLNQFSTKDDFTLTARNSCDCNYLEKDQLLSCKGIQEKTVGGCQSNTSNLFLIILIFSIFLNLTQILFNQPRKIFHEFLINQQKSELKGEKETDPMMPPENPQEEFIHQSPTHKHTRVSTEPFEAEELQAGFDQSTIPLLSVDQHENIQILQSIPESSKQLNPNRRRRKSSLQENDVWKRSYNDDKPIQFKRSNTVDFIDLAGQTNPFLRSGTDSITKNTDEYQLVDIDFLDESVRACKNAQVRKISYSGPYHHKKSDFWVEMEDDMSEINSGFMIE